MLLRTVLFLCGAAVMSIEFLASRVIAPEFGDSLYVWGALIGSFIGALSLGYWLGGIAADRWPTRLGLGGIIAVAGLLLVVMVPFTRGITSWLFSLQMDFERGLWLKPVLATVLIYFAPIVLLGAVNPYCVRLAARDLSRLGKRVGGFYAISSLGSIFGTFLTAFWLIGVRVEFFGYIGVRATIMAEGLLLMALSIPLYIAGFFFEEATGLPGA